MTDFAKKKLLEICCFSLKSCKNAELGRANRIELCGGFLEGGTTPSVGLLSSVLDQVNIPVYVMIRPRGGDFLYNEDEIQVMLADIKLLKKLQPAGFVIGMLQSDGNIDMAGNARLLKAIGDFPVTFHRAFDMCKNPHLAIEQLISLGIENILTSGQFPTAPEAIGNLKEYKQTAANRINIMAGSGVNPRNIPEIAAVNVDAFHFSAKKAFPSLMTYRNPNIKMGAEDADEFMNIEADVETIKMAREAIERLYTS
ncbi:copper homeostasis protein CutC [Lacihabitans soyangensis]|uniref:PF03932 family protein CutC n=1 Tax=Lacihabitans soyangensis TaxID=869394 RepID=A0AAE3KT12_9BACT|nr:copper homeostasis protein CutC [Lacihabitans soyangensis]MCP9763209.1 copper homeostasis protein CutC [Lacihabitans soyangensis]